MSRHTGVLIALASLSLAGCASTGLGGSMSPADSTDIRDQLFKLQKDSARLLNKMDALEESGASANLQATCAEAVTRMEEVERRVSALEEQTLATQRRIEEALVELRAMRRGGGWSTGSGTPGNAGTNTEPWPKAPPRTSSGTTSSGPSVASGAAPEDLFNAAYSDYSRGKYELALAGFEGARNSDPSGPLADDAQYWAGETLFAMGRHAEASAAFDAVIKDYGTGDKVVGAHLKKGLALVEARRTTEGVMALQYVIETWPQSDEARIAHEYFRRKGIVQD